MELSSGTYLIRNIRANLALELYNHHQIVCHGAHSGPVQLWYLQRSARGYALKNVECGQYLGINDTRCGSQLEKVCEHNANIWTVVHQYDNVYTVSIIDTQMCMALPDGHDEGGTHVLISEKKMIKGELWGFERVSDDSGGIHNPQSARHFYPQLASTMTSSNPNTIVSGDPNGPYIDDAHFHADMLFNMPRNQFTRLQRAAVLDWARRMGTPNVPTLESLDECERQIEERQMRARGNNSTETNE
ncbi:hypothetical protein BDV93DRAFT_520407 [Ceratobasidium sp. AG-I]|nr:hypothetical protein BDV93DRAFT_520407 [Ceratobasidium sp. AG-I]